MIEENIEYLKEETLENMNIQQLFEYNNKLMKIILENDKNIREIIKKINIEEE